MYDPLILPPHADRKNFILDMVVGFAVVIGIPRHDTDLGKNTKLMSTIPLNITEDGTNDDDTRHFNLDKNDEIISVIPAFNCYKVEGNTKSGWQVLGYVFGDSFQPDWEKLRVEYK
jgi:hypothetical protein